MFSKNGLFRFHLPKQSLAAWGISLCAVFGAEVAHAQIDYTFNNTIAKNAGIWSAVSGNSTTMGMGASGAVTPSGSLYQQLGSGANLSGWTAAGNYGVAQGATGVTVNARGSAAVPGGKSVPVSVTSRIKPASLGKGLAALARAVPFLGTGIAIYDFGQSIGFGIDRDVFGNVSVTKSDPTVCSVAPCNEVRYVIDSGAQASFPWTSSPAAACAASVTAYASLYGFTVTSNGLINSNGISDVCSWTVTAPFYNSGTTTPSYRSVPPVSSSVPSSLLDFENAIAAKSGWPTTDTKMQEAVKQAIESGQSFDVDTPTVTGPATSPGESSTTQGFDTAGNPTTTTTTKTNQHIYNNNSVTTNTTTVTNVTNNNTGAVTTTTVNTTPAPSSDPVDSCSANPERVGCKNIDIPMDKVPTKDETITWAEENLGFGPGACPSPYSFSVMQTLYPKTYTIDLAQFCNTMSNVVRPLVILFSLLAAFFIVAPVTTREI